MTAKIFRNAFLIGFTVLLACILLFFFIMYSNYQAQAYDILEVEAEHIAEGMADLRRRRVSRRDAV